MSDTKYYMFDDELWSEGRFYDCYAENGKLISLKKENGESKSVYISAPINSGERETVWHRMRMNINIAGDSAVKFSYFAADYDEVVIDKNKASISSIINDDSIDFAEKLYMLDRLWIAEKQNPTDIFLFDAKGRYLYFKIEMISYDNSAPSIEGFRLDFPQKSIIDYIPQFYSDYDINNFTKRFLGIFQSYIFDIQEKIDEISSFIDVDNAEERFVQWLAQWVSVDNISMWSGERLRRLIKSSVSMYKKKGTKECLYEIVEIYTGARPVIKETFEIIDCFKSKDYGYEYSRLYGGDVYSFYIFVESKYIRNYRQFIELSNVVNFHKPVNTAANIIVLKPSIVLGQHSYLSVNSNISSNSELRLEGENTTLPFNTTIFD